MSFLRQRNVLAYAAIVWTACAVETLRAQVPVADAPPVPEAAQALIRIYTGSDPPVYQGSGFVFHSSGELTYVCLPHAGASPNINYIGVTHVAGQAKRVPLTPVRSGHFSAFGTMTGTAVFSAPKDLLPEPLKWDPAVVLKGDDRAVIVVGDVLPTGQSPSLTFPRVALRGKLIAASTTSTDPIKIREARQAVFGAIDNADRKFEARQALICDEQGKPIAFLGWKDEYYDRQRVVTPLEFFDSVSFGEIVGIRTAPPADGATKLQIDLAITPLTKAPESVKVTAAPLPKTEDLEKLIEGSPNYLAGAPPTGSVDLVELKPGPPSPDLVRQQRSEFNGPKPEPVFFTATVDAPQVYQDGGGLWLFGSWRDESGRERRINLFPVMSKAYADLQKQLRDERRKAEMTARADSAAPTPTTPPPSGTAAKITPIPAAELK